MKNLLSKRWVTLVLAVVIVAVLAGGALAFLHFREAKTLTPVYLASELADRGVTLESVLEGTAEPLSAQEVHVSGESSAALILVEEGQTVSAGDILVRFDSEELSRQKERIENDIALLQTTIAQTQSELNLYLTTYASQISTVLPTSAVRATAAPSAKVTAKASTQSVSEETLPEPTEEVGGETAAPVITVQPAAVTGGDLLPDAETDILPDAEESYGPYSVLTGDSNPVSGSGTVSAPYVFLVTSGAVTANSFVERFVSGHDSNVYLRYEIRENDEADGKMICALDVTYSPEGTPEYTLFVSADATVTTPEPAATPSPQTTTTIITVNTTPTPMPTSAIVSIKQTYIEKREELEELKLDLQQLQLDLSRVEMRLENTDVYSLMDGVVSDILTPSQAALTGKPLFSVIGSEGGLAVTVEVAEDILSSLSTGNSVSVSYEGGKTTGKIADIGATPTRTEDNTSYYRFTVLLDETAPVSEGMAVELLLTAEAQAAQGAFYLETAYVREDSEGLSYVLVENEDGVLEQRYVETGSLVGGCFLEICGGLSESDYIAFPYGEEAVIGRGTVRATAPTVLPNAQ